MIDQLIVINAECTSLPGRAFAVAAILTDRRGEIAAAVHRCPVDEPVSPWVADNVLPHLGDIPVDCADYPALTAAVRTTLDQWTGTGEQRTPVAVHVAWPVEARLLVDVYPGDDVWKGPYPLYDVAPILAARGHDPINIGAYLAAHQLPAPAGQPHHPLYDVRVAERCLRHLLET